MSQLYRQVTPPLQQAIQLHSKGELRGAEKLYRQILQSTPDSSGALHNLAIILVKKKAFAEAIELLERACALIPDNAEILNSLGTTLNKDGQLAASHAAFNRALQLAPDDSRILFNLAKLEEDSGHSQKAMNLYRRVLDQRPHYFKAMLNLAYLHGEAAEYDQANALYRQVLQGLADDSLTHSSNDAGGLDNKERARLVQQASFNLASNLLLQGEYDEGFAYYESRLQAADSRPHRMQYTQPLWNGERFAGKKLLVHTEQGFGDCFQFIRYLPLVCELGGETILECQSNLASLFANMPGKFTLCTRIQELPAFDLQIPLLSLPHVFRTNLNSIPAEIPYLFAKPAPPSIIRHSKRLKVGLVWQGNFKLISGRGRSIRLPSLRPIVAQMGCDFYSLQVADAAEELKHWQHRDRVIDLSSYLVDFSRTAQVIEALDLVISIDTAVAHLAGALGKAIWLMQMSEDWRWLQDRNDSPWYPTMRIFRKQPDEELSHLIAAVVDALQQKLVAESYETEVAILREDSDASITKPGREIASLRERALQHYHAGENTQAAVLYARLIELNPRDAEAYNHLGVIRLLQKRYSEALILFNQAIDLDDETALYYNNRFVAEKNLGQIAAAEQSLLLALRLDPCYVDAYINKGNLYRHLGDSHRAGQCHQRARRLEQLGY